MIDLLNMELLQKTACPYLVSSSNQSEKCAIFSRFSLKMTFFGLFLSYFDHFRLLEVIFHFSDDRPVKYGAFAKNRMSLSSSQLELERKMCRFWPFFAFFINLVEIMSYFDHLSSSRKIFTQQWTCSLDLRFICKKPHVNSYLRSP